MTFSSKNIDALARDALFRLFEEMFKKEGSFRLAVNVKELAQLLNINATAAYKIVKSENFPKIRVGCRLIIPVLPLLNWLDQESKKNGRQEINEKHDRNKP